ncbi:MAG TPA: hypothetical protein PLG59_20655 [bacterium]|nr:hypothetical protein [bacterium]HQO37085.1 hypothetical protein [bacterium]HQP98026.1 hypothetical protein [bacterium]
MKKKTEKITESADRDTMRPEYDFRGGVRGATAAKYAEGTNLVVIAPDLLDVFPDGESVNETLRALAPVIRKRRRKAGGGK